MNTFTASELADFYQKVADGGEIGFRHTTLGEFNPALVGPCLHSNSQDWYIKPAKKSIDLSVLIDSQIDCEFEDNSSWEVTTFGKLYSLDTSNFLPKVIDLSVLIDSQIDCTHDLTDGYGPLDDTWTEEALCEARVVPRTKYKHAWDGGDCPLPEGFRVKVWYRNGRVSTNRVTNFSRWSHTLAGNDIIYFEVLSVADDYVMPWGIE
jgi:hypothetical protein